MGQKAESELNKLVSGYARHIFIWSPILCGLIHQIAMVIGRFTDNPEQYDKIPVFVNPPGHIGPFVSLEYQWWLVLALGAGIMAFLIGFRRLRTIPTRIIIPFYVYLVFLLIFVKPV